MSTTLIRHFENIPFPLKGSVATIGNFDGVHLGHQALIQKVVAKAKERNAPSLVITFEPHPFEFFAKAREIPRITRLREKLTEIAKFNVDGILILNFNQALAEEPASTFVTRILHDKLRVGHIILGDDFHFGWKRLGDVQLLTEMGKSLDFSVETLPTVVQQHERISSTRVRAALMQGDLIMANALLGRAFSLTGYVRSGDQRGRKMGVPTANIYLHRKLTPIRGVFTVLMHGISDHPIPGVANIGVRPTVDGTTCLLEVHLLDFNQDIYGRLVRVEFCEKLRDEIRFDNIELLFKQIYLDIENARHYFKKQGTL